MLTKDHLLEWIHSPRIAPFVPKLITTLFKGYSRKDFCYDLPAGITVAIISLPLAMAFAIAAGLEPERGLYTAIVAGGLNAIFSGSRFVIGGPTGAYILIMSSIVQKYGYDGLACATLQASVLLFLLGFFQYGKLIRFISYPVIVGFTCGVAVTLFASQSKYLLGLRIPHTSSHTIGHLHLTYQHAEKLDINALFLAIITLATILVFRKLSKKSPGIIIALTLATIINWCFALETPTIQSKFGAISHAFPVIQWPHISFALLSKTFPDAVGITLLCAIQSLLVTVIADSLTGTKHKSNCELIAQSVANIGAVAVGGVPSCGTIARTTANIQVHAKTPISGIIHAITILLITVLIAPVVSLIPLCSIAALLIYVAWNMFDFAYIKELFYNWRTEAYVMLITFAITIFVDLTTAVQIGVLISLVLFLQKSTETAKGKIWQAIENTEGKEEEGGIWKIVLPHDIKVYELEGPFFFAVADILTEIFSYFDEQPHTLIIRMRAVPFIDATGTKSLRRFVQQCNTRKVHLFLAELQPDVLQSLEQTEFFKIFPKNRVLHSIDELIPPIPKTT